MLATRAQEFHIGSYSDTPASFVAVIRPSRTAFVQLTAGRGRSPTRCRTFRERAMMWPDGPPVVMNVALRICELTHCFQGAFSGHSAQIEQNASEAVVVHSEFTDVTGVSWVTCGHRRRPGRSLICGATGFSWVFNKLLNAGREKVVLP